MFEKSSEDTPDIILCVCACVRHCLEILKNKIYSLKLPLYTHICIDFEYLVIFLKTRVLCRRKISCIFITE